MGFNWNPIKAIESAGRTVGGAVGSVISLGSSVVGDVLDIGGQALNYMVAGGLGPAAWSAIKHWLIPDLRKDRELMTNASDTPRRWVYGRCRVSGQLAYAESSGANNETLHLVIILAGRELTEIESIFLDDTPLANYGAAVSVTQYLGDQTTADAGLVAASLANQGAVTITATGNTVSGVARIGSIPSVIGLFAGMTVTGAGMPGGVTVSYVGDTYVDLSANATATGTGVSFSFTGTAERWTSDHILKGCAYLYLSFTYSEGLFPSGLPKVTAVVKGHAVYDPRTATTVYSDNPALCIYDYMLTSAQAGGMGCISAEINTASIITAANICDQTVIKSITDATNTEKRYTCNGAFSIDGTPKQILDSLMQSMLGTSVYTEGVWNIFAGAYTASVATIDESWLAGDITFTCGSSKADRINTIKGTFIDPTDSWSLKEFPLLTVDDYIDEDGGEELLAEITLNFTTSPTMAQRIAKIILEKARMGGGIQYPCNFKAFKLDVGDTVTVNNSLLGWTDKVVKIADKSFNPMGGITLTLNPEASTVYDWVPSTDITPIYLPPATSLPDPSKVAPPTGLTVTPRVYDYNTGANTRVDVDVAWTSGQAGINNYKVEWRYFTFGDFDPDGGWLPPLETKDTIISIPGIAEGRYDFRLSAINAFNVQSAYVYALDVFVPNADTDIPTVTGLEIFNQGNDGEFLGKEVVLRWHKVNPRSGYVAAYGPAGANKPAAWFRYFELEVYDGADTPGTDVPLRTEYLNVEFYTYTHEKNHADHGGVSASRSLKFRLRAVATWGYGAWSSLGFATTNPAPDALTIPTIAYGIRNFTVYFPKSTALDLAGYNIHVSQTNNFTPDSSNLLYSGPNNYATKTLTAGGTWYVKVAAFDAFGDDELNYSDQKTVVVPDSQINTDDINENAVSEVHQYSFGNWLDADTDTTGAGWLNMTGAVLSMPAEGTYQSAYLFGSILLDSTSGGLEYVYLSRGVGNTYLLAVYPVPAGFKGIVNIRVPYVYDPDLPLSILGLGFYMSGGTVSYGGHMAGAEVFKK